MRYMQKWWSKQNPGEAVLKKLLGRYSCLRWCDCCKELRCVVCRNAFGNQPTAGASQKGSWRVGQPATRAWEDNIPKPKKKKKKKEKSSKAEAISGSSDDDDDDDFDAKDEARKSKLKTVGASRRPVKDASRSKIVKHIQSAEHMKAVQQQQLRLHQVSLPSAVVRVNLSVLFLCCVS